MTARWVYKDSHSWSPKFLLYYCNNDVFHLPLNSHFWKTNNPYITRTEYKCIIWWKNINTSRHTRFSPFINCFLFVIDSWPQQRLQKSSWKVKKLTVPLENLFRKRLKTAQNEATNGEDKEANKKGNESPVIHQSKKKAKRNKPIARKQKRKVRIK